MAMSVERRRHIMADIITFLSEHARTAKEAVHASTIAEITGYTSQVVSQVVASDPEHHVGWYQHPKTRQKVYFLNQPDRIPSYEGI